MKIVFVHFGPKLPKFLNLNIQRICNLFPHLQIVLLVDNYHSNLVQRNNLEIQFIPLNENYSNIRNLLTHPKEFRNNFWFSSLARLNAIADYVINNDTPVLHIESDVLLSSDFPIDDFSKLDRPISYTILGENSGVASIFWLGSARAALKFKDFIDKSVSANPDTTDMRILGHFQRENPNEVRVLASFPIEEGNTNFPLPISIANDFKYTQELFNGFFDAADLGQYLFGDDPRNHRGIKYLRHELPTSYLIPSSLSYVFSESRSFLSLNSLSSKNVYSLHIHSKDISLFRIKSSEMQIRRAIKCADLPEKHTFVIRIFLQSVWISLLRRSRNFLRGELQ